MSHAHTHEKKEEKSAILHPRKVLMFGWEFPPHNSGGLGVACWGLTRALADLGVDVTFVLPKKVPVESVHCKLCFAESYGTISLRKIDTCLTPYITSEQYRSMRGRTPGMYGASLFDEVLRYGVLARDIARDEEFDVIHAHDWLSFLAGIEAKKISGKPLVVHVHATEFDRVGDGPVNQFVYDIEREGMEEADKVIAVSQFTKDILTQKYGILEEKIEVVHNGVEERDFVSETSVPEFIEQIKKSDKKVVLFVGRITLQKGPDYFVKVAKKVLEYMSDVYFVVAGSGDMEGRMIEDVARAGISDKFIFTGFLRGDELDSIYQSADLYIMPSVSEPFGIAPLEAVMQGAPALISKQSGVSEVLKHSLKADFWDIDDMANKVLGVLEHPALQKTLSKSSRKEAKGINWNEAAQKCILLYNEL